MVSDKIIIRGAREHNLKNIDLTLPKNKLIVFTGLSGSGKSSLAFDTLYAEGQRRYVESLSSYARQFLGMMKKPDVEIIEGLSPAISIDQKSVSSNPRSTVGTITEIYDYLRLLYARVGHPHCPNCGREVSRQTAEQIVDNIIKRYEDMAAQKKVKQARFIILSPVIRGKKGEFTQLFQTLAKKGYTQVRIDNQIYSLDDDFILIKTNKHTIDAVSGRFILPKPGEPASVKKDFVSRLSVSVESALKLSDGMVTSSWIDDAGFAFPEKPEKFVDSLYSEKLACPFCNISIPEIEPRTFSFNSPYGACPTCSGIGSILKIDQDIVVNKKLSVSEGGILPFSNLFSQDTWFARIVKTVGDKYSINLRVPISQLPEKSLAILLYGTGDEIFKVYGENRFGRPTVIEEKFEGLIVNLERRWLETESEYIRMEIERFMRRRTCPACLGRRLKAEALAVKIDGKSIDHITAMSIEISHQWFNQLPELLNSKENEIASGIFKEIKSRLNFLISVGLEYLTLDRTSGSLAGGEAQRIRLASQIGSGLSGVLYILDEPSIGLHQRDNKRLIETLKHLRDLGNTVVVVEHDREMMENADYLVDFGPLAGEAGGRVVAQGTPEEVKKNRQSLTGRYLSGKSRLPANNSTIPPSEQYLTLTGCSEHNLKNIDLHLPLNRFVCITGVSGSGKSTLVDDTLYHAIASHLYHFHSQKPGAFQSISGENDIHNCILVDQSPIGRTPRSNPATYVGAFTFIRQVFSQTKEARLKGFGQGRFSFNVKGGRCEACKGEGQIRIEMQFLAPIWIDCEACNGKRYNTETLQIEFKEKNISQILDLTIDESLQFFSNIPPLRNKLQTLVDVGLGYIKLGQPAPTLSGGEAQRVKLAKELSKSGTMQTLYILDEPTTGLHFEDLKKLLVVLKRLVEMGNTVAVIEHNLDVISQADWVIDLGPQGGDKGGYIVTQGTPKDLTKVSGSYTGQYLAKMLQ